MKFNLIAVVVGLIATSIVVGIVHGRLTNRWGTQPDLLEAARRLEAMPLELEGWHLVRETELSQAASDMLQCKGSVRRIYENNQTGDHVSVVVLLGPSGPIAVHTPEICYSSRDYRIERDRVACELSDGDQLWDLRLKANDDRNLPLRVMYGWTNNGTWQATEQPRFTFGGRPMLYKIQLAGPVKVSEERDACKDFLGVFLPSLRSHLADGA